MPPPSSPPVHPIQEQEIELPWLDPLSGRDGPLVLAYRVGSTLYHLARGAPMSAWVEFLRATADLTPGEQAQTQGAISVWWDVELGRPAFVPLAQLHEFLAANCRGLATSLRVSRPVGPGETQAISNAMEDWLVLHDVRTHVPRTTINQRIYEHALKPDQYFWSNNRWAQQPGGPAVGIEFEAEFARSEKREDAMEALFLFSEEMSAPADEASGRGHTTLRSAMLSPRLHIEADGSLDGPSFECPSMPHAVREPATYYFLNGIYSRLAANGAQDTDDRVGMHVHLSRSYFLVAGTPLSTSKAERSLCYHLLHLFSCAAIRGAQSLPVYFSDGHQRSHSGSFLFTGRAALNRYCQPDVRPPGYDSRFRHLNHQNEETIEFRIFGPAKFRIPDWPGIVHDLVLAMADTAIAFYTHLSPYRANANVNVNLTPLSPIAQIVFYWLDASAYQRDPLAPSSLVSTSALRVLMRCIADAPDVYPFAARHFFGKEETIRFRELVHPPTSTPNPTI